ncbi:MAG: hypothetical protein H6Q72_937 [Firmicutes bacterium]|nr:hypothetical protein [Bacillota bacterium]
MDAKIVVSASGHGRPSGLLGVLELMNAIVVDSPYIQMPPIAAPKGKPQRQFAILCCKNCQSTGTLQKVDGEYYCRKCVRVVKHSD